MTRIRKFSIEDIPEVAALRTLIYRRSKTQVADGLLDYLETVYFRNPWVNSGIHSYVHLAEDGTINGFAGPQDFNFTDGSSLLGSKVWASCGGKPAQLYSREWRKIFLPFSALLARAKSRIGPVVELVRPIASLLDIAVTRLPIRAYKADDVNVVDIQVATTAEILELRDLLESDAELGAVYDQESFDWLLAETSKADTRGQLQKIIVKDQSGTPLGWYIYFAHARGKADVMQLGAHPDHVDEVLGSLILRAKCDGATELTGQFDPRYADALSKAGCRFTPNCCFWVHPRNSKISDAIDTGHMRLSRLDGEWWLRFSDGPW